VSDKVISPSTGIFPGTVSGSRTGRTLSFTSVYDFGPRATFTGTIGKNGIEGKLTGVCVGGANVIFTKQ
jgi:hypothetical protein